MNESWTAPDGGRVTIRPIRAADLALEAEFVNRLSALTGYRRLMSARRLTLEELRRFTDIDPARERALIATTLENGRERQIAVARYVRSEAGGDAELAIVISDDWQRRGLGTALLERLISQARRDRVRRLVATALSDNGAMQALARKLGFTLARNRESASITDLTLVL
ncbi:MAG: N-acetyltransferase family protein [Burkholderiales bacterium]